MSSTFVHLLFVTGLAGLLAVAGCKKHAASSDTPTGSTAGAKKALVVGFAQVGAESGWRTANTKSIKDEAARRGVVLRFSDAQQKQENQIKAIRAFVAQGVNVIMFSPVVSTGWTPVLQEVKAAGIPVIISDRTVDSPDGLYTTFIGSDFVEEGRRAGEWMAKHTSGKAMIAELQGTPGSAPANDRAKGFREAIAGYPEMRVIMTQSGDFTRAGGKQVMEAFLKSPQGKDITAVFAHNDDMALGAIQAMQEAGAKPGVAITVVSIDGVHDAFQAMIEGTLNCTVECNPLIGSQLFDAAEAIMAGKPVSKRIVSTEGVFEQSQAAAAIAGRGY